MVLLIAIHLKLIKGHIGKLKYSCKVSYKDVAVCLNGLLACVLLGKLERSLLCTTTVVHDRLTIYMG